MQYSSNLSAFSTLTYWKVFSTSHCSVMYALVPHKPTSLLKAAAVIVISQPFIPTPLPTLLSCRHKCELNGETDLHGKELCFVCFLPA